MVKRQLHPLLFLSILVTLYIAVRVLRAATDQLHTFIAFHFTDLLFIPMQLTICLVAVRCLKRDHRIRIPAALVFFITAWMSVLFEWYLPVYSKSVFQTADIMDVIMYFAGANLFLVIQKRWLSS